MKTWLRYLEVRVSNESETLSFGNNWQNGKDDFSIEVSGNKYLSTMKDTCMIKIDNLTPLTVVRLVKEKFFRLEVIAGYREGNKQTVFKGGITYISNSPNIKRTNTVVILGANELAALYGQSRLNLTLRSGINMYSALEFIFNANNIKNYKISKEFQKEFLQETFNANGSAASIIDSLCNQNINYIANSDGSSQTLLDIFNADESNGREIDLTTNNCIFIDGYPKLNNDGVSFKTLFLYNFKCGDTIKLDNSKFDISIYNHGEIEQNKGNYFNSDGLYMIMEMSYELSNRGNSFYVEILAKRRDYVSVYSGG